MNAMDTETPQIAKMILAPEIACGDWHPDRWMGGYLRGRFRPAPGTWRLTLGIFIPRNEEAAIRVLVRRGPDRVLGEIAAIRGRLVEWFHDLGIGEDEPQLDILLRTNCLCAKKESDGRSLGVVLAAFHLTRAPAASGVCREPARSDPDHEHRL